MLPYSALLMLLTNHRPDTDILERVKFDHALSVIVSKNFKFAYHSKMLIVLFVKSSHVKFPQDSFQTLY